MEPFDPSLGVPAAPPPAAQVHVHVKRHLPALLILVYIAGFFALTSLALLFALVMVAASKGSPTPVRSRKPFVEKFVGGDKSASDRVLVVRVDGVMSNTPERRLMTEGIGMVDRVTKILEQAESDGRVKAVLLCVNSPGGAITSADVMYDRLVAFRTSTKRKMVALLEDVAASGGYYVAAATDRIVAHPTTLTGSIGVIMPLISLKGVLDKIGVKPQPIKSRPLKDMGAFYRELTDQERTLLQAIVAELYDRFVTVVQDGATRRGAARLTRKKILALADGRVFTGEQAAANGLVDETGYLHDAVAAVKKLAGLKRVRLVRYVPRSKSLVELLQAHVEPSASREITVRLGGLGLPPSCMPMYLWSPGTPTLFSSGPNP